MQIGIAGFPSSGKSTMLGAATHGTVSSGSATRLGTTKVPDKRLEKLAEIFNPKRVVNAEITFVESPPAVWGEDVFGGKMQGWLQQMDAIMIVVRAFEDDSVPHMEGNVDFKRDLERLAFNFAFADIDLIDRRIQRMKLDTKGKTVAERADMENRVEILKRLQGELELGKRVLQMKLGTNEKRAIGDAFLMSSLPLLVAINIGEEDIGRADEIEREAVLALDDDSVPCAALCAKLEAELAEMSDQEEAEMREGLGAPAESGLAKTIGMTYRALGLVSFLTTGEDEVRAWPVKSNSTAPKAAGKIHSDIERGFIRAEVVTYQDFTEAGNIAEARRRGLLRQEGKDYIVKDGDIVNFLFSV